MEQVPKATPGLAGIAGSSRHGLLLNGKHPRGGSEGTDEAWAGLISSDRPVVFTGHTRIPQPKRGRQPVPSRLGNSSCILGHRKGGLREGFPSRPCPETNAAPPHAARGCRSGSAGRSRLKISVGATVRHEQVGQPQAGARALTLAPRAESRCGATRLHLSQSRSESYRRQVAAAAAAMYVPHQLQGKNDAARSGNERQDDESFKRDGPGGRAGRQGSLVRSLRATHE